jgi:hypothetical protein
MAKDEKKKEDSSGAAEGGLCLENYCMTSIKAQETEETSEIPRRLSRAILLLVLVAVTIGALIWWATEGRNLAYTPTEQDQQFLQKLNEISLAKEKVIGYLRMQGPYTIHFDILPNFTLEGNQENQDRLRKSINEMVASFSTQRPDKSVRIIGYQEGKAVAEGRFMLENFARGKPPIWIHIEGEEMGAGASGTFE